MEEIIAFIFIWMFVDIIVFAFFYGTGRFLTPVVSFGQWKPDGIFRDEGAKIRIKDQSGILLLNKSGVTYLGVGGVIGLGVIFWMLMTIFFIVL